MTLDDHVSRVVPFNGLNRYSKIPLRTRVVLSLVFFLFKRELWRITFTHRIFSPRLFFHSFLTIRLALSFRQNVRDLLYSIDT